MAAHPLTLNLVMQKARVDRPNLVRQLNVSGSQVDDIGIIEQMTSLEVVSLAANDISDLGPLTHCERLQKVFLRKNDIVDLFQVLHLRGLKQLRSLTLNDNPISSHDCYRRYVIAALPQLETLDDAPITPEERAAARAEFPDVTACEIPLPLPTKRELHEQGGRPSQSGSPLLKRGTPTATPSGSFASPPQQAPAATASPAQPPVSQAQPSSQPQRAPAPQRHRRTDSSDAFTDGSDADGRRGSDYDDRPVGGGRPNVPPRRGPQHADPSAAAPEESPAEEEIYEDSCDSESQVQRCPQRRGPARSAPTRTGGATRPPQQQQQRPGIPLSPQPMGIREENVVRAVNLLLSELSPAGLDAVRRQLDMLDMR